MAGTERPQTPGQMALTDAGYQQALPAPRQQHSPTWANSWMHLNVGISERIASGALGTALALAGLGRRNVPGLVAAAIGGALIYRGATGHCYVYEALDIDTTRDQQRSTHVTHSLLIDKSPDELYTYWRNFENLPQIMTHLKSVRVIDQRRSHWIAKAPGIAGGEVEWDAEITADEPGAHIQWRSLPDSRIEHRGSVRFTKALGDRGTAVRVELDYVPPAGELGRWVAKLFGEEPAQQIRDDLRNFKRTMELGEVLTISGQPRGTCTGSGRRES